MKSGEGGLGSRREGVVGEVGVCAGVGLTGAVLCTGVLAPELLLISLRSSGLALPQLPLPLPGVPAAVPDLGCTPVPERDPLRLRKWYRRSLNHLRTSRTVSPVRVTRRSTSSWSGN